MNKIQVLSVDLLRLDAGTQCRVRISEETVEDYAELIAASNGKWPLGPLDVFHDGAEHYVADGFHRTLAAIRVKRSSVPCRLRKGTAKDARIFGMTANDHHGLRMTREDKRACVEWLLDTYCGKMTQQKIAELSGVSKRTVQEIVADRKPKLIPPNTPLSATKAQSARPSEVSGTNPREVGGDRNSNAGGSAAINEPPPTPESVGGAQPSSAAAPAKQAMKTWMDAIGRWMNGNPDGIDVYREQWPGPKGDRVIEAAKELWNAINDWKKGIK